MKKKLGAKIRRLSSQVESSHVDVLEGSVFDEEEDDEDGVGDGEHDPGHDVDRLSDSNRVLNDPPS